MIFFFLLQSRSLCSSSGYIDRRQIGRRIIGLRKRRALVGVKAATLLVDEEKRETVTEKKKPRILVAGGGIRGLVFALAAKKKGFHVLVFEKDLSAIRGEGQYRGPIQIQSNALAAFEAIDIGVAEEVMEAGCITGDRINGLVDGVSGTWYVKFDTFTPAASRGLPVTRVISRMTLQQILARAVGEEIIRNESNVVDFEDSGDKVTVVLEDGQRYDGDLRMVAWTAIISGHVQNGESERGLEYLCKMHSVGSDDEKLNATTLECGFQACGNLGALEEGSCLHGFAVKNGLASSNVVNSSTFSLYTKCGSSAEAYLSFRELDGDDEDVFSWTSIIASLARSRDMEGSFGMFCEMQRKDIQPLEYNG